MAGSMITRSRIAQPDDQFHIRSPYSLPLLIVFILRCRSLCTSYPRSSCFLFTADADRSDHLIGGGEHLNSSGHLNILDVQHFANAEVGHVDREFMGDQARQALDLDLVEKLIDDAPNIAHLTRHTLKHDWH